MAYGNGPWGESPEWGVDTLGPSVAGVGVTPEEVDLYPLNSVFDTKHKYRYLTVLSRMIGSTVNFGRVDTGTGQVLLQETAANGTPDRENDYLESFALREISLLPNSGNKIELFPPINDYEPMTHYTVYRTKNIDADDADFSRVEDTYLYNDDIPLSKLGYALYFDIELNQKSGFMTLESITMGIEDVGCTLVSETVGGDPALEFVIVEFINRTTTTVVFRISKYDQSDITDIDLDKWYYIGGEKFYRGARTVLPNGEVVYTKSLGTDFSEDDVGKQIFWADGNVSFISKYNDDSEVVVEDTGRVPTDFNSVGNFVATIGAVGRVYNDTVTDDTLSIYERSGDSIYFLQTRFFKPLPNGGFGATKGGAYFVSSTTDSLYHYSQLRDLYRTGSFHPDLQINTKPVGVISRLKDYPDVLCIFGKNFTYFLDTTIEVNGGESKFGEFVLVYQDPKLVTKKIGCPAEGNAAEIDNGGEVIMTNEPSIRFFDGFKYGDDLSVNLIQETEIAQLLPGVVMEWDRRRGLNMWGIDG